MDTDDGFLTDNVFGLSRDVPLNYVERENVDGKFINELGRDQHIVLYGSSKQGKTCLRKECLRDDEYVVVQCSNRAGLRELHAGILKSAGFELKQSETRTVSGTRKVMASLKAKMFGAGAEAGAEAKKGEATEKTHTPMELDVEDVNDVIRALDSVDFDKFIVLEDFHYLPSETQQDFAVALKAFHEKSQYSFIVIGVWLEENRLIVHNGDLAGRVVAVDVDQWSDEELRQVIEKGEDLLNIKFTDQFVLDLLSNCESNVYIVQEACRLACRSADITNTMEETTVVGDSIDAQAVVREVIDAQRGRYTSFLVQFATGYQKTELEMYKWLLYPVLRADVDDLRQGLGYRRIREEIESQHPEGAELNPGNLTQALQNTAPLQVKKKVKPIVLDYDQSNSKLNIVDRGFLIWLEHQNRTDLMDHVDLPSDIPAEQLHFYEGARYASRVEGGD